MKNQQHPIKVASFAALQEAIANQSKELVITNSILCYHSIILPENASLSGDDPNGIIPLLTFNSGDGIGLTANNTISNLAIQTPADQKAIFLVSAKEHLGSFHFENLTLTGQFSFIARGGVLRAKVSINQLDILAADSRKYSEQPQKYGVNALQGALTIYNFNTNPESILEVFAENISVGRPNAPVIGSGVFISGAGDNGGRVDLINLHTNAVYSNGMLPYGVADIITGGIFVVNGVKADKVAHDGEIVTYGVNGMVLDTWGEVGTWTCNAPVVSHGPSGVGFVNFGKVKKFILNAPLITYGLGARGYNQYDGTVDDIALQSVTTYGDGSVAIQISKEIGKLTVKGDITTHGSTGNSLVKGVNVQLPAIPLSIKEGGKVKEIFVGGNLISSGDGVTTLSVDAGIVEKIDIHGEIIANGENSKLVDVINGGQILDVISPPTAR